MQPSRGVLFYGPPGCGKTMLAKAIANEWNMGFRRVHPDELVGSCVGDNETFMRDLVNELAVEAPVVCFMDEAEKLLGQTRAGTMYRAADAARDSAESILLQFMEDDDSGVFFIFTANDYDKMSPALLDRFHGRFFIDLPSRSARKDIISSMLEIRQRNPSDYDIERLVGISDGFSGRDIRTAIDEAMKLAFFQDARPLVESDLVGAFSQAIPTSEIHLDQIAEMREMVSQGKMRRANSQELEAGALVVKDGGQIEWV
jgi:SpoVK/Ycf46/Vps4 family AAA+-type ATPase